MRLLWPIADLMPDPAFDPDRWSDTYRPPESHRYLLRQGDRINICDVEFIYYQKLPIPKSDPVDDGDVIVTMGAGHISAVSHELPQKLAAKEGAA